MSEETTLYVVDSDPAGRESAAAIARSKGLTVREIESSDAFLSTTDGAERACVILDTGDHETTASDLLIRVQQISPDMAVIMVGPADVRTAVRAMHQGAVTYLAKPLDTDELSAAIDLALERTKPINHVNHDLRSRFEQLTASEREVLSRVIEGQPNRRIASDMDLGLRTVELRRSNIMRKTGATNLSELIRLAIEVKFPHGLAPLATAGETDRVDVQGSPDAPA
jgi:two-component system response regulator FixJ